MIYFFKLDFEFEKAKNIRLFIMLHTKNPSPIKDYFLFLQDYQLVMDSLAVYPQSVLPSTQRIYEGSYA